METQSVTVRFENVGRNKLCWTAELREFSEQCVAAEVRCKGALLSSYPYYDLVTGLISAGMYSVGRFYQVQPEASLAV